MKFSNDSVRTLVEVRDPLRWRSGNKIVFVTINPNPKVKIPVLKGRSNIKMMYGQLPYSIQYNYCVRILKSIVWLLSGDAEVICTAELPGIKSSNPNLHMHMMIYDPEIKNDYDLIIFRREVNNLVEIMKQHINKKSQNNYAVNIVFWDDETKDLIEYFDKDYVSKIKHFKNIIVQNYTDDMTMQDVCYRFRDLTSTNYKEDVLI